MPLITLGDSASLTVNSVSSMQNISNVKSGDVFRLIHYTILKNMTLKVLFPFQTLSIIFVLPFCSKTKCFLRYLQEALCVCMNMCTHTHMCTWAWVCMCVYVRENIGPYTMLLHIKNTWCTQQSRNRFGHIYIFLHLTLVN